MPFRYRSDSGYFNDTCKFCGEWLTGEQVFFCSDRCRVAAYRARKRAAASA